MLWPMSTTKLSLVHLEPAMSTIINIHDAKTHLSRIVDDVAVLVV
jgi:hypothetical protein